MNTNHITNINDDLKTFRAIPLPEMANTFIYQQKMSKIKSGMRMHTLSKMEDAMKRSVANVSDVDESSASLPPRQR
ncbi:hypothetical protein G6F46_006576 [Rhizopus delemar]|uniref:Uncharacterized protein n=3 Tax=Rhizopus TaxID=4842 RepID=I1BZJ0_RHIO9|nr:hypothetical protein RO3G_06325 [Rhizopus delemar RA 99-880]KAG1506478.1 hypothetical protein G6F53_009658 [Rhizopus delemar]KAG1542199.1 hypothetical protein G6F51_007422 [Rhizopus arrhizus]KAG1546184.1 hypothetical protein G6F49_010576 [Rhizopus delemar]KAG1566899.1 hypothetical protein G6F50_008708 [Rhizopus delemar]|eukprot:EIE81620.1 hypothetical protein RO3G_06325 [Rhizopus delemar RA 99-880]